MTLDSESLLQMGRLAASAEEGLQAGLDRALKRASAAREEAASRHRERLSFVDQLDSQAGSLAKASREIASQVLDEEDIHELESTGQTVAPTDDLESAWKSALEARQALGDCLLAINAWKDTRNYILFFGLLMLIVIGIPFLVKFLLI